VRRTGARSPSGAKPRVGARPRSGGKPRVGARHLLVIAALALVLPLLAASPARAGFGPPPVTCPPGSSCYLWLYSHAHFGGSHTTGYIPIPVQPPPCTWNPMGNVQTGSQALVSSYNGKPPASNAPNGQYATYTQAQQMLATHSTEKGEWYYRPDQPNQPAVCNSEPRWFFAVPGEPLPGSTLTPVSVAELDTSTLNIPAAGQMILSPVKGPTYSNLPTFVRVTFDRAYEIGPDGAPYVTDQAAVYGAAATVWVIAKPIQLSVNDSTATMYTAGCGYLGSQEMTLHPKQVASTGANGKADCGVTFHQPGNWTITATLTWRTCWVPEVVYSPPPAVCNPVPNANLNPVTWTRTVAVHEIQAANGSGT
jgi:hypothetical protein